MVEYSEGGCEMGCSWLRSKVDSPQNLKLRPRHDAMVRAREPDWVPRRPFREATSTRYIMHGINILNVFGMLSTRQRLRLVLLNRHHLFRLEFALGCLKTLIPPLVAHDPHPLSQEIYTPVCVAICPQLEGLPPARL